MSWIAVEKCMPDHGQQVLATYVNSAGMRRHIIGYYFEANKEEGPCDDECATEYNEELDEYYYREGWYEQQDNWGDYASIFVHEGDVTHWRPIPRFEADE